MSEENKQENLQKSKEVSGKDATEALAKAFTVEGVLKNNLEERITKLEGQVELLKDLFARSLKIKKSEVLKG